MRWFVDETAGHSAGSIYFASQHRLEVPYPCVVPEDTAIWFIYDPNSDCHRCIKARGDNESMAAWADLIEATNAVVLEDPACFFVKFPTEALVFLKLKYST